MVALMTTTKAVSDRLPGGFDVIELRRYTVKPEERASFGLAFETYFPEAFQQLGSLIFGHFDERGDPSRFTWIRGFHDVPARTAVNQAFYDGPLWREHSATMNDRLLDHTDVLLLAPVSAAWALPVLPAVDVLRETSAARGVAVLNIFPIHRAALDAATSTAEKRHGARRKGGGVRPAGLLASLDVANDFPRLPFRTDGPYLVAVTIVRDDAALADELLPIAGDLADALEAQGAVRARPELVVLEPRRRSRLRWTPS
jgi:hypothetical protein